MRRVHAARRRPRTGASTPGCSAACHSGCHCTQRLKPGASGDRERLDQAVGRARLDAQARRRGGSRPGRARELTSKRLRLEQRLEHAAGHRRRRRARGRTARSTRRIVRRRGGRDGPRTSCTAWCRLPPSATLVSWKPRQIANSGMPRASASRDQRQRPGVALRVERQAGVVHVLAEVARVHVRRRAGQQHAVGEVEQRRRSRRARRSARPAAGSRPAAPRRRTSCRRCGTGAAPSMRLQAGTSTTRLVAARWRMRAIGRASRPSGRSLAVAARQRADDLVDVLAAR